MSGLWCTCSSGSQTLEAHEWHVGLFQTQTLAKTLLEPAVLGFLYGVVVCCLGWFNVGIECIFQHMVSGRVERRPRRMFTFHNAMIFLAVFPGTGKMDVTGKSRSGGLYPPLFPKEFIIFATAHVDLTTTHNGCTGLPYSSPPVNDLPAPSAAESGPLPVNLLSPAMGIHGNQDASHMLGTILLLLHAAAVLAQRFFGSGSGLVRRLNTP